MPEAKTAAEFYGASYLKGKGEALDKAFRYLQMATDPENTEQKREMALKAALKYEGEAFG